MDVSGPKVLGLYPYNAAHALTKIGPGTSICFGDMASGSPTHRAHNDDRNMAVKMTTRLPWQGHGSHALPHKQGCWQNWVICEM
eukprot:1159464-Pelagomonas_calceolata.AAC.7